MKSRDRYGVTDAGSKYPTFTSAEYWAGQGLVDDALVEQSFLVGAWEMRLVVSAAIQVCASDQGVRHSLLSRRGVVVRHVDILDCIAVRGYILAFVSPAPVLSQYPLQQIGIGASRNTIQGII